MKMLGRHLVVEYSECDNRKLNDLPYLEEAMQQVIRDEMEPSAGERVSG